MPGASTPERCPLLSPLAVEGNSDELDEPIKAVFADVAFVQRHNLMSLNSINWSRVLVQMAHHFFAYFQCTPSLDMHPLPTVEVVVPTGAGGNLAGKETLGCKWTFQKALSPSSCLPPTNMERKEVVFCSKEDREPHRMPSNLLRLRVEYSRVLKQKEIERSILGKFSTLAWACTTASRQNSRFSHQT